MKTFRQIILALALTSPLLAEAQLINLTKQLENLAGKIQENQTSSIEKPIQATTLEQTESVKIYQKYGLIGSWSKNCQNINYIHTNQIENGKVVSHSSFKSNTVNANYMIIDKAKMLNEKQLHYIGQVYSTSNNQHLRTISGVIYINEGKTSVVYLEVIADGKSEITVKDGLNTKDNSKQPLLTKCN